MNAHARPRTVLVTGATGKVGRHLVRSLSDAGVGVRALVRDPNAGGRGAADLPDDVELVTGDLTRAETVAEAARGADAAFLLWMGFDAGAAGATVAALADHVSRIVYLSAAELQDDRVGVKEGPWSRVEDAIHAAGVGWTFLRAGGFAANALGWAPDIRAGRPVGMPYPEAVRSPVHERDIADVALRSLLDPELHDRKAYEITGPEQLSLRAQAEILGVTPGRPVTVHHQSIEEATAELSPTMSPDYAESALAYWATLETSPERVSDDVPRVLGRPARTFAAWARDHADDFAAITGAAAR